ncbi:MAG: AEC family transporter [Prochloraceae cyanobacterium]
MNDAIDKTISFIFLILIGSLLKNNIARKEHLEGVKLLIFNTALPATILLAILQIKIQFTLIFLPILALSFNLMMLGLSRFMLPRLGFSINSPSGRTMMMLLPSLAPGLSCFPYILEYLGEEPLAWAALADLGNKFFVLILLYLLAMNWYCSLRKRPSRHFNLNFKILLGALFKQPTNLAIVIGLILISFGLNLESLPFFVRDAVERMSNMMTPLMLLFIGLVVKFSRQQISQIAALLFFRAGIALCFSALLITVLPLNSIDMKILAVVFPLSSCSFLAYAHMYSINMLKEGSLKSTKKLPVFDLDLGLTLLALSLPFSTLSILSVCVAKSFFTNSIHLLSIGILLIFSAGILWVLNYQLKKESARSKKLKIKKNSLIVCSNGRCCNDKLNNSYKK